MNKNGIVVQSEKAGANDIESRAQEKFKDFEDEENMDPALAEFERNRREYINAMKRIRLENPDINPIELEMRAREEITSKGPKSRAYYRLQASRKLAGKTDPSKANALALQKELEDAAAAEAEAEVEPEKVVDGVMRIFFDPPHYTVMENIGSFNVTIVREGGDLNLPVQVDYKTEDGTACSPDDYSGVAGTLTFGPGETEKTVELSVEDDDLFEEDEHFYIRVSNPRRKDGIAIPDMTSLETGETVPSLALGIPAMSTIMILDDDHGGVFCFEEHEAEITEIAISEEDTYEKNVILYVVIGEPRHISGPPGEGEGVDYAALDAKGEENWTEDERISTLGRPRLGDVTKIQIRIRESKEFKSSVDRMMQRGNASVMAGANSWKDQILSSFTVQAAGDDDEEEEEGEEGAEKEEKMPTCGDYIMHFLTLFWKVIFSFIPPAAIGKGYPCFVVSIAMIGACTALIGDIAGHLGCF